MPRAARFVATSLVLAVSTAQAAPALPGVSARPRVLEISLTPTPEEHVCAGISPAPWRDASDALFFASGPTSRLDMQELAVHTVAPLISLNVALGELRLFVLGAPVRGAGVQFSTFGWRPRWPFC